MQRLVDDQTAKKSSNSGSKNAKFLYLTKNFQTRQFRWISHYIHKLSHNQNSTIS